eukprot:4557513-Amphidinium_carterae.1
MEGTLETRNIIYPHFVRIQANLVRYASMTSASGKNNSYEGISFTKKSLSAAQLKALKKRLLLANLLRPPKQYNIDKR